MNNITLNIVEPGSGPTPIDPSTEPIVPNTGLFTKGIGGPEATIITISIVAILAIAAAAVLCYKKKHSKETKEHKVSKSNRLANALAIAKSKKKVSIPLAVLAMVVSLGTLAALLVNAGKGNTSAIDNTEENEESTSSLTLDVDSEELTIEVGDTPVFAVLPVELTVEEATQAGYTLTAYADSTDIVSTINPDNKIPMVAIPEEDLSEYTSLTDDTWGLSLEQPEDENSKVYTVLSTDADNPTMITDKDYEETGENDAITIYYGFYITPDTPYGTYEGSEIYYGATANEIATVVFNGKGLYFNGDKSQTTNITKYIIEASENMKKYSHTPNVNNDGLVDGGVKFGTQVNEVITIPGASSLNVEYTYGGGYTTFYHRLEGFGSFWEGSHPEYTPDVNYGVGKQSCGTSGVVDGKYYTDDGSSATVECSVSGDTVTFGYWTSGGGPGSKAASYGYYAVVTGYDVDGNIIYLPENKMVSGDYIIPGSDSYYRFLGWSKSSESTTPTYASEEDIEKELDLTLNGTTTLYAVWEPAFTISYNGNGADSTTNMDQVEQYTTDITSTEKQVDLIAPNFTRSGYGFVGWSADQNAWDNLTDDDDFNNPTIYGPNQTITVDPSTSAKLALYAVWTPAETDDSGNPVSLQDWQGCSNLTATTYDSATGTLNVGKNTITALTDSRDGNIYTVARLADGNCWMTENLRLDNEATISTANTNKPVTVDNSIAIKNNDGNTSAHLSPTNNSWCTNSDSDCHDQSYLNTNNSMLPATSPTFNQDFTSGSHNSSFDANVVSYSNYYNWYSATAGNGTHNKESGEVTGDICPAGWSLPIGYEDNTSGSFYYLNQQMGAIHGHTPSNKWRAFPNNFVYSGYWGGSSAVNRGNSGYYWSSTAGNINGTYGLSFYSDSIYPGTNYGIKGNGFSIRCVAPAQ